MSFEDYESLVLDNCLDGFQWNKCRFIDFEGVLNRVDDSLYCFTITLACGSQVRHRIYLAMYDDRGDILHRRFDLEGGPRHGTLYISGNLIAYRDSYDSLVYRFNPSNPR